ncbi:MAG: hypothetical protein OXC67_03090 [Flavobacteriaceae bacterium]|nr:hypothetical protein [Flavobacteriaceae bacterium]MCY4299597.1 hypothetical protein [Flavobacteriaceae bacterium]
MYKFLHNNKSPHKFKIENWLNLWLGKYPNNHLGDLNRRIHLNDFSQFMSAYFELQIFSILRRLNCEIKIHPPFLTTQKSVDFGVKNNGEKFYIEATVCGLGKSKIRENKNEEDAVEKIKDNVTNLQYHIWLQSDGLLKETISKKRLIAKTQELLDTGKPQMIQIGDWKMIMTREPIQSSGNVGRVWGPMKASYFDGSKLFQNALRKKIRGLEKKRINHPFIIAINACDIEYSSNFDELNAIYPDEVLINRHPMVGNDAFDKYLSCVAGILVFNKATLGSEEVATVRLFKNPRHTIPKCLGFLEQEHKLGDLIGLNEIKDQQHS